MIILDFDFEKKILIQAFFYFNRAYIGDFVKLSEIVSYLNEQFEREEMQQDFVLNKLEGFARFETERLVILHERLNRSHKRGLVGVSGGECSA
jgi:hypothetical protein